MPREYKFRGEPIHGKCSVCGYFKKNRAGDCYIEYDGLVTVVKPDSVVPLVGHDINGEEVYEGDWLYDEVNEEYYKVKLDAVDGNYFLDSPYVGLAISEIRSLQLSLGPDDEEEE